MRKNLALTLSMVGLLSAAIAAPLRAQGRNLELADAMEQNLVELTITYAGDPYNLRFSFKSVAKEDLMVTVPWGYIAATRGTQSTRFLLLASIGYPVGAGATVDYAMPVLLMEPELGLPAKGTEYERLLVDDSVRQVLGAAKKKFASDNDGRKLDPVWYMESLRAMLWYDPELGEKDASKLIQDMEPDAKKQVSLLSLALEWQLSRMSQMLKAEDDS
jgi:hypothetical protein